MKVISRQEMYQCDSYTIQKLGIPGKELMETAGRKSAEYIQDFYGCDAGDIIIFCGSGNNGGDGFVIARYLSKIYRVCLIFVGREHKMSEETRINYDLCRQISSIDLHTINCMEEWHKSEINIAEYGILVDAIFGVGFKGNLRGWLAELITEINNKSNTVIAIDIPSGVDAENGNCSIAVKARTTLTMAAVKYGLLLDAGLFHSGNIQVLDIGIPPEVISEKTDFATLLEAKAINLPERKSYYHKGKYGRIAIIAGSRGYTGAAVMSARAALRSGAGLVTVFHPAGLEDVFETMLLEAMTRTIKSPQELLEDLQAFDTVLFGPGVGKGKEASEVLQMLLCNWKKPLIIDADGLNLLSENKELQEKLKGKNLLLTPHLGEFARLCRISIGELMENRVQILRRYCQENQISVLLKSASTIGCNSQKLFFDISGNDGLATGGSGDVLSGIAISLTGQGMSPFKAGRAASFILGNTADKLLSSRNPRSILPTDIIENLFLSDFEL